LTAIYCPQAGKAITFQLAIHNDGGEDENDLVGGCDNAWFLTSG
jgi:hypothetical protein